MGSPVAILALVFVFLFTAPMVLGAYVFAQGQDRRLVVGWFGMLTALFALSFLLAVASLVLLSLNM
jgi:hypothetical protein